MARAGSSGRSPQRGGRSAFSWRAGLRPEPRPAQEIEAAPDGRLGRPAPAEPPGEREGVHLARRDAHPPGLGERRAVLPDALDIAAAGAVEPALPPRRRGDVDEPTAGRGGDVFQARSVFAHRIPPSMPSDAQGRPEPDLVPAVSVGRNGATSAPISSPPQPASDPGSTCSPCRGDRFGSAGGECRSRQAAEDDQTKMVHASSLSRRFNPAATV